MGRLTKPLFSAIGLILFAGCQSETEKKLNFFNRMVPMIRDFIQVNAIPVDPAFDTNQITDWKVEFYKDRKGGQGYIRLGDRYGFKFYAEKNGIEIRRFKDVGIKTYFHLEEAPREKIEAIKTLNLRNKLNEKTAMELATKYFKLQGHREEDFHPPECLQRYWSGPIPGADHNLPYYGVEWFRKDVKMADVEQGFAQPSVLIEVSGITTNLISYTKSGMPVGSDF